jgi:rhomboid protease GluP
MERRDGKQMRQMDTAQIDARPLAALYSSERGTPPAVRDPRLVEAPAEREPTPYVTYALAGINVLIFLLMMAVGHGNIDAVAILFGAKVNTLIQQGQWWRLLTPIFLHGSLLHVVSNSLSLIWFGSGIERLYGARKYLLIYFVAGVAGNIASYIHMPALSLGASGAIFGLVGAGLMFPIRFRSLLPANAPSRILGQIWPIAAINLFIGFTTPSIDNWAHMGGLAGGALVALFLIPDALTDREPGRAQQGLLSAACVCVLLITLLAGFRQWRWAVSQGAAMVANVPALDRYGVGSVEDPWWSLGVPPDWKPVKGALAWTSPEGVRLDVQDSTQDPTLLQEVQMTREKAKPNITIDGHPAWQVRFTKGGETSDLFLIPVYDRVVQLIFSPSDYANSRYVDTVKQIITSIHFDHAPIAKPTPAT